MTISAFRSLRSIRRKWRLSFGVTDERHMLLTAVRSQQPHFKAAVLGDLRVASAYRGERFAFRSRTDVLLHAVRLAIVSDAFFAQCCYRAKARTQALGIPLLPSVLHRLAIMTGQISIGEPVVLQPGVYIPHGQIVADGYTKVARGAVLFPFVNLGLKAGTMIGPTIESRASIGTGAKVIGPVRVGRGATVGANAVVVADVPDHATVVGVPARTVGRPREPR